MNETSDKKKPLSRWRRILLILVLLALIPLFFLMLINCFFGRQLGAELIKISKAGEPIKFSDVKTLLQSDATGNEAAKYYLAMLADIFPTNIEQLARLNSFYRKNLFSLPINQFPEDLRKAVTANLNRFQQNFVKLDLAASLPLSFMDLGIEQGRDVSRANLNRVQIAAFSLSFRTLDLFLQGQHGKAADSIISMLKLLRVFDSYPLMSAYITKARLVSVACEDVRLLTERGNASDKSIDELVKALKETIPANSLERMLLVERVFQIEFARNLFPGKTGLKYLQKQSANLKHRIPRPRSLLTWVRIRKQATQYFRDMTRLITAARHPWPEPFEVAFADTTSPAEKTSDIMTVAKKIVLMSIETHIAVDCTMLALTIERYRRQHNKIPDSLDNLFPGYTESIPVDPFTGKKLFYRTDEDSYMIYSVGFNRVDDGGSIIPELNEKSPKDWGFGKSFQKETVSSEDKLLK